MRQVFLCGRLAAGVLLRPAPTRIARLFCRSAFARITFLNFFGAALLGDGDVAETNAERQGSKRGDDLLFDHGGPLERGKKAMTGHRVEVKAQPGSLDARGMSGVEGKAF